MAFFLSDKWAPFGVISAVTALLLLNMHAARTNDRISDIRELLSRPEKYDGRSVELINARIDGPGHVVKGGFRVAVAGLPEAEAGAAIDLLGRWNRDKSITVIAAEVVPHKSVRRIAMYASSSLAVIILLWMLFRRLRTEGKEGLFHA